MTASQGESDRLCSVIGDIVEYIFDETREEEWRDFCDCISDASIQSIPATVFFKHMQAAYLQLLGGALMRSQGGPAAILADPAGVFRLGEAKDRAIEAHKGYDREIEKFKAVYNAAYGSSSDDGIGAMVRQLNASAADGKLSPGVVHAITENFVGMWQLWTTKLAHASGKAPVMPTGSSKPPSGAGCLVVIAAGLGFVAVLACMVGIGVYFVS